MLNSSNLVTEVLASHGSSSDPSLPDSEEGFPKLVLYVRIGSEVTFDWILKNGISQITLAGLRLSSDTQLRSLGRELTGGQEVSRLDEESTNVVELFEQVCLKIGQRGD